MKAIYQTLDPDARAHVDRVLAKLIFATGKERAEYERDLENIINRPHKFAPEVTTLAYALFERLSHFAEYLKAAESGKPLGHA